MNCVFCNIDNSKIENTIIEETDNFYILPTLGSLVDGYLLIISKKHMNSMSELSNQEKEEYESILKKYRNLFYLKYGRFPIIFEHGSPVIDSDMKANSVLHAHTHIVNHHYFDEQKVIEKMNFKQVAGLNMLTNKHNYIMYLNQNNVLYVTNQFEAVSQIMRKLIAEDLGCENMFDWKKEKFINNIRSTIKKMK